MRLANIWEIYKYGGISVLLTAIRYGLRSVWARQTGQPYIQKQIYDFEMWLDVQDKGISRTLLLFGERELEQRQILQLVLKPSMTVLDIGANIGYYVLIESGFIANGKIIAVEPVPSNMELLKKNLTLNGVKNVITIPGAVSNHRGKKEFYLSNMSNLGMFRASGSATKHLSGEVISVETWAVGEIAAEYGIPDLIRMDVEGHEVTILNGMLDDIRSGKFAPFILFETHLTSYSEDNDMASTLKSLFQLGYYVQYLASSTATKTPIIWERGYREIASIPTGFTVRSIFENIKNEDAIDFICRTGGVRTVLLAKTT